MGLGENIKQRRLAMGLKQKQLADKLGVTSYAVSKVENGHEDNMSVARLEKYAKTLNCSSIDLMDISELSFREKEILRIFNMLSEDVQDKLIDVFKQILRCD